MNSQNGFNEIDLDALFDRAITSIDTRFPASSKPSMPPLAEYSSVSAWKPVTWRGKSQCDAVYRHNSYDPRVIRIIAWNFRCSFPQFGHVMSELGIDRTAENQFRNELLSENPKDLEKLLRTSISFREELLRNLMETIPDPADSEEVEEADEDIRCWVDGSLPLFGYCNSPLFSRESLDPGALEAMADLRCLGAASPAWILPSIS